MKMVCERRSVVCKWRLVRLCVTVKEIFSKFCCKTLFTYTDNLQNSFRLQKATDIESLPTGFLCQRLFVNFVYCLHNTFNGIKTSAKRNSTEYIFNINKTHTYLFQNGTKYELNISKIHTYLFHFPKPLKYIIFS